MTMLLEQLLLGSVSARAPGEHLLNPVNLLYRSHDSCFSNKRRWEMQLAVYLMIFGAMLAAW